MLVLHRVVELLTKAKERVGKMFNLKTVSVVFLVATVFVFCLSCGDLSHTTDDIAYSENGELMAIVEEFNPTAQKNSISTEKRSEIARILDDNLVQWAGAQLRNKPANSTGFRMSDPLEVFQIATQKPRDFMSYVETRANGREVYRDNNGNTVKRRTQNGYWKYISRTQKTNWGMDLGSAMLSDEQARSKLVDIFDKLGLQKDEMGQVFSTGIGVSTEEDIKTQTGTVVGRYIEIQRQINGVLDFDSKVAATYELDGNLTSLEVRWPEFRLPEGCAIWDRDGFIAKVSSEMPELFADVNEGRGVASRTVYVFDEDAGVHVPSLQFSYENGTKLGFNRPEQKDLFLSLCKSPQIERVH